MRIRNTGLGSSSSDDGFNFKVPAPIGLLSNGIWQPKNVGGYGSLWPDPTSEKNCNYKFWNFFKIVFFYYPVLQWKYLTGKNVSPHCFSIFIGVGSWSGQNLRIRQKDPDPTRSGSPLLLPNSAIYGYRFRDLSFSDTDFKVLDAGKSIWCSALVVPIYLDILA
jgi:hypothetical protein